MSRRRWRFARDVWGCDVITSALIVLLNTGMHEDYIGFMFITCYMGEEEDNAKH